MDEEKTKTKKSLHWAWRTLIIVAVIGVFFLLEQKYDLGTYSTIGMAATDEDDGWKFSPSGDTSTTIYGMRVQNDKLVVIPANGFVGINNSDPHNALEVVGSINASEIKVGNVKVCQADGVNCPAGGAGTQYNLLNVTATNDSGKHTFIFGMNNTSPISVTIEDQTGAGAGLTNNSDATFRILNISTQLNVANTNLTCNQISGCGAGGFTNGSSISINYGNASQWNMSTINFGKTNATTDQINNGTNNQWDNRSWDQAAATTLFYPRNTNPQGFYNSSTFTNYYPLLTNPLGYYNASTTTVYLTTSNPLGYYNSSNGVLDNTTWAQSLATTLYLGIGATAANSLLLNGQSGNYYLNNTLSVCFSNGTNCQAAGSPANSGWLNNTNQVWLSNNATNVSVGQPATLFVDSTNAKVGVNTSIPTHTFNVRGSMNVTGATVMQGCTMTANATHLNLTCGNLQTFFGG